MLAMLVPRASEAKPQTRVDTAKPARKTSEAMVSKPIVIGVHKENNTNGKVVYNCGQTASLSRVCTWETS